MIGDFTVIQEEHRLYIQIHTLAVTINVLKDSCNWQKKEMLHIFLHVSLFSQFMLYILKSNPVFTANFLTFILKKLTQSGNSNAWCYSKHAY